MKYLHFIKENRSLLTFGLMLTFFSSFGQTFLIALYVPSFMQKFGFSNGEFGTLYGIVTLASAFALTFVGKLIDRYSIKAYTIASVIFMGLALLAIAVSSNIVTFIFGLWALRLAGQGLMPHIAVTSMARYFPAKFRGTAIGTSTLGHPLGEALFPIIIALIIINVGYQEALMVSAAALILVLVPFVKRGLELRPFKEVIESESSERVVNWTQWQVLKSKKFLVTAPAIFILPMLTTAFFFYQVPLSDAEGWSAKWIASCFIGYAIANSLSMLASGPLIDKHTARTLFPYHLIPLGMGLATILIFDGAWTAIVYMIFVGISSGFGSTIRSALQAELFGTVTLGAVRSIYSTLIVISTAVGPAMFGLLLDGGYSFNVLLGVSIAILLITMAQSFLVLPAISIKRLLIRFRYTPIMNIK